jgi:hypothetical protein
LVFGFLNTECGFQNYQALQVEVNHKVANGLTFQANYSWAKNLSDAQGDAPNGYTGEVLYGQAVSDRFNLRADRGNVAGTRTHRFLLTGTYEVPFGTGRHWYAHSRFANAVLGGWNLNTITLLETGPWLTPTTSSTLDQSNTNIAGRGTSYDRTWSAIRFRPNKPPQPTSISSLCLHTGGRRASRERWRGHFGGPRNHHSGRWPIQGISDYREYAAEIRIDVHERAESYQLRSSGNKY